jgi:dethiobiotin synthase
VPRVVVLGSGTSVGKTRTSVALLRALSGPCRQTIGLKPIESGVRSHSIDPPPGSDAEALARAGSSPVTVQHPLHALPQPVSPHRAARDLGLEILLESVVSWVRYAESMTPLAVPHMALWSVVETAGGVFSPLSEHMTNFDLALTLEPAIWILVAPDAIGVLHDVSATLQAMRARGRAPDHVVLSAARASDASTGGNAGELSALGIVTPTAVLERDNDSGIADLVRRLLAEER